MCFYRIRLAETVILNPDTGYLIIINFNLIMNSNQEDGRLRKNVQPGLYVEIVQKHHQRSGELTEGVVKRILTKSSNHPHGIKVLLDTGEVGRVKKVLED